MAILPRKLTRLPLLALALALGLGVPTRSAARQSVLYGGGPLYTDDAAHRERIRESGFTPLVIWTIHVEAGGTNDDLTSLKVAPGHAAVLFEHDHFDGDGRDNFSEFAENGDPQ